MSDFKAAIAIGLILAAAVSLEIALVLGLLLVFIVLFLHSGADWSKGGRYGDTKKE